MASSSPSIDWDRALQRLIAESEVITLLRRHKEDTVKLRLGDLIPRHELEEALVELIEDILDRTITLQVLDSGTETTVTSANYVCPECNNVFQSSAALGGHRYWKHDVARKATKSAKELANESRERTHAYQESLKE